MLLRMLVSALLVFVVSCAGTKSPSVYKAPAGSEIIFTGGSGGSYEDAIVIRGATNQSDAVAAEYHYLSGLNGQKDNFWRVHAQSIFKDEKRVYDVIQIELIPSNEKRIYYFDITRLPWDKINR